MPRQKLPEGWKYNSDGNAYYAGLPLEVGMTDHFISNDGVRCLGVAANTPDTIQQSPTQVALAVIRNAGLDQVYESAKRLVKHQPKQPGRDPADFADSLSELTKLIESLEEP